MVGLLARTNTGNMQAYRTNAMHKLTEPPLYKFVFATALQCDGVTGVAHIWPVIVCLLLGLALAVLA